MPRLREVEYWPKRGQWRLKNLNLSFSAFIMIGFSQTRPPLRAPVQETPRSETPSWSHGWSHVNHQTDDKQTECFPVPGLFMVSMIQDVAILIYFNNSLSEKYFHASPVDLKTDGST